MSSGCPICSADLEIKIYTSSSKTKVITKESDKHQNLIRRALIGYWRWICEGKPKNQYYHDNYHNHIEYIEDDIYYFRIQIFDSPEGDTWISGRFRVSGLSCIEILEKYIEG